MNHTPGPWVKDYNGSVGHIKSLWEGHGFINEKYRKTPTVARYDVLSITISKEEQEANARLIAAAPELLEALWVCAEHNALHFGECHNTVIQARAAIAKARGES